MQSFTNKRNNVGISHRWKGYNKLFVNEEYEDNLRSLRPKESNPTTQLAKEEETYLFLYFVSILVFDFYI